MSCVCVCVWCVPANIVFNSLSAVSGLLVIMLVGYYFNVWLLLLSNRSSMSCFGTLLDLISCVHYQVACSEVA